MTNKEKLIKDQRDRFLAFSFTAADLLLEINSDDMITYASGAAKSLTGEDEKTLIGRGWIGIFAENDRAMLNSMHQCAKPGKRCGPFLVDTKTSNPKVKKKVLLSGMILPEGDGFFMTLSAASSILSLIGVDDTTIEEPKPLADKDVFEATLSEILGQAKENGEDVKVTLLDIEKLDELKQSLGEEQWEAFFEEVGDILKNHAVHEDGAATLEEGKFCLLHSDNTNPDDVTAQISKIAKAVDPKQLGITIQKLTMEGKLDTLKNKEATRALIYTLNQFEKQGMELSIDNLEDSFAEYLEANTLKISALKSRMALQKFSLLFQPIVNIHEKSLSHYEVFTHFKDIDSPKELMTFGEDVGIAADIDMAVCRRIIKYLQHTPDFDGKLAVNISGQSIENGQFFNALLELLNENQSLSDHLILELIETAHFSNFEHVLNATKQLKNCGFDICLDDFGASPSSFQYLNDLELSYVKIESMYTHDIESNPQHAIVVKNMAQMCSELDIKVIAEHIETPEQAMFIKNLGVSLGQGWNFGKAEANPSYTITE